jgi:hypothetical protein
MTQSWAVTALPPPAGLVSDVAAGSVQPAVDRFVVAEARGATTSSAAIAATHANAARARTRTRGIA